MGNYTIFWMFENPTRGRQARNFATNVPKTLDLKSSSEQMFSLNSRWVPLIGSFTRKLSLWRHLSILQMSPVVGSVERWLYSEAYTSLMACLHGGGGPQIGEVTCSGLPHLPGVPHLHVNGPQLYSRIHWVTCQEFLCLHDSFKYWYCRKRKKKEDSQSCFRGLGQHVRFSAIQSEISPNLAHPRCNKL